MNSSDAACHTKIFSEKQALRWCDAGISAGAATLESHLAPAACVARASESFRTHVLVITLVVALCSGLYAWTADFPMVFDDEMYMKGNLIFEDARSFNFPTRFTEFANLTKKIGGDPDLVTNFILRPVAYATLHLNYALDGYNPRWFRLVNVVIHSANSMIIYALLRLLLRHSARSRELPHGSAFFIPTAAALLFAAHPLATESVTYIIQRFTSLSTLFYLLTLWLYFASLHAASRTGVWVLRTSAVAVVVLGMLTKECVFTAPLMAVLIDRLVNGTRIRQALVRALPLLMCLPIIPILVILTSAAQHEGRFSLATALNIVNSGDHPLSHWHYIVTQITVVAAYLRHIFWPSGLNLDPEWPVRRSLLEAPVLAALAQLAALTAGAWWMWHRRRCDARASLAFVFTLWFFVTVAVSSGLVPLPDLMADHRSYLPSIGIFTLIACLLDRLRTSRRQPAVAGALVPVLVMICVGALAWATCARNQVWRTKESLWEDTVAKSPGKYRTWGNLGVAYAHHGKDEEAVKCYRKALSIEPKFQNGMFNLSNALLALNRPKEAVETTFKLLEINKGAARLPPVAYTLAHGLARIGRLDDAIAVLSDLLEAEPGNGRAHKLLGLVYLQKNQPRFALMHFHQATKCQVKDTDLPSAIMTAKSQLMTPVADSSFNPLIQLR